MVFLNIYTAFIKCIRSKALLQKLKFLMQVQVNLWALSHALPPQTKNTSMDIVLSIKVRNIRGEVEAGVKTNINIRE